ncbi:DNA polymerase III subunit gamma/tau [bacterium]|nr:DNA polymerase III subunit gamma/tau [bacterium]
MSKKPESKYTTLYREYRPAVFNEVQGQDHIVSVLESAIHKKKISHAYLFSGGRGTGKTSVARIFARALGVTDKDMIEMDAASNRGIDDIRELREGVYAMPFESPYKCYLVDEAHMLTKDAWNALLKTLEEPPAHALFILATTEIDKVPDTIRSRCEVYAFKQPTREMLADTIVAVAKKEKYTMERSAAELVALLAEGSFRDALSILQKVLTVAEETKVTLSHVESVTGAPRGELVRSFVKAIAEKDAPRALRCITEAVQNNIDIRIFSRLILQRLRVVLLLRFAPDLADELSRELSEADTTLVHTLSKNPSVTSETIKIMLEAYATMAVAALPHLPLELAVVDMCKKI